MAKNRLFKMKECYNMRENVGNSHGQKIQKVQIEDNIFSADEIIAYYEDILESLKNGKRSLNNKVEYIKVAKLLLQKKEFRKALGIIYQALSRYSDDSSIIKLVIETFIAQKDLENAGKILNEYTLKHPNDLSIKLLKARILREKGDFKGEEQALLEVVVTPRYDYLSNKIKDVAYERLGDIYMQSGRYEQAEGVAEELMKRTKDEPIWSLYFASLHKQDKDDKLMKAKDDFARFKRARIYFDKGYEYEKEFKFNLARINYSKGLQIYSAYADINIKTGNILMHRKKWFSKAEEFIKRAVELDPEQANYISSMVLCLKKQGKYKEAYPYAIDAAKMDPESNMFLLRNISRKLGKENEFIEILEEVINEDTGNEIPGLRYEMGLFVEKTEGIEEADKWFKKSLEGYKRLTGNFPEDWELYFELGDCYNKLKAYDLAEKAYLMAEDIEGCDLSFIYERLVDIYQKTNRPDKSAPYLKEMVKLHPGRLVNYIDLGINYLSRLTSSIRKKEFKEKKEQSE